MGRWALTRCGYSRVDIAAHRFHQVGDHRGHLNQLPDSPLAWFPKLATTHIDALVAACERRDVGVYSIARHARRPLRCGGLILGYGLVDERAIDVGARVLAGAYRKIANGPIA
jgi:hypothetical protein